MQIIRTEVRQNFNTIEPELLVALSMSLIPAQASLETETGREQLGAEFVEQLASAINKLKVKNEL